MRRLASSNILLAQASNHPNEAKVLLWGNLVFLRLAGLAGFFKDEFIVKEKIKNHGNDGGKNKSTCGLNEGV